MSRLRSVSLPFAAALVLAGGLVSPASAEQPDIPMVAVASGAAETVGDWTEPDESADAAPETILADLEPGETATLVAVRVEDGKPVVEHITAPTAHAATLEIRRQQADEDLIAIELESEVGLLEDPVSPLLTNDPQRASLWGLDRLRAETAWPVVDGAGVVVAVIDTGVARHPDLAGSVVPGVDLSGSGGDGRNDGHSHGTHVAGTIAATANNGIGIAGVAPGVAIMPVKVLGDGGSGSSGDVARGIIWAADRGADIINMSLGSDTPSPATETAVRYAIDRGVTVIAAAGNDGGFGSPLSYPANYPGVVSVGATTSQDRRAFFSSFNSSVDVAAPGAAILSTVPGGGYATKNGTSMAAPHAAGGGCIGAPARATTRPDRQYRWPAHVLGRRSGRARARR